MKYEDVAWHDNAAEYPKGLPRQAAGTHTGMFLAWALLGRLGSTLHAGRLAQLRAREVTPGAFFFDQCDGKLTDEDLSAEGNAFAKAYFDPESGRYARDYDALLCDGLQSAYHVRDTWENFDKLRPRIDRRLAEWRRGELGRKPWWKFWEPFALALAFVLPPPPADAQIHPTELRLVGTGKSIIRGQCSSRRWPARWESGCSPRSSHRASGPTIAPPG